MCQAGEGLFIGWVLVIPRPGTRFRPSLASNRHIPRHEPLVPIPSCRLSWSHRHEQPRRASNGGSTWPSWLCRAQRDVADVLPRNKGKLTRRQSQWPENVCTCVTKLSLTTRQFTESTQNQNRHRCVELVKCATQWRKKKRTKLNQQSVNGSTCRGHGSKSVKQTTEWSTRAPRGRHIRVRPGEPRTSARAVGTPQDQKDKH